MVIVRIFSPTAQETVPSGLIVPPVTDMVAVSALPASWPWASYARAGTVNREQRIMVIKTMEMSFFISVSSSICLGSFRC